MDGRLLRAFHYQIKDQCHFVELALEGIEGFKGDDRFWYGIQNVLTSAANISKLLWGQGGKYAKERAPLRASVGVDDSSPLRPTTMRNHYEHMDERLTLWWATSERHIFADQSIGPPTMFGSIDETDTFRAYDPTTGLLRFWGDTFDLIDLINEIHRLHPLVEAAIKRA